MLKANVGLSRKLSKDFNSTGFSLNLESELVAAIDDPESVIERIRELYDVADEALQRQIEAHRSESAIAGRDADDQSGHGSHGGPNGRRQDGHDGAPSPNGHRDGKAPNGDPASNKQVQFLTSLGKRRKLFGAKLDEFIEETIGRRCSPYDLTKREAGAVIDALNPEGPGEDRSH